MNLHMANKWCYTVTANLNSCLSECCVMEGFKNIHLLFRINGEVKKKRFKNVSCIS